MINKETGMRELVYVARINEIKPIEGRDRVECAMIGGWSVMVRREQFKVGDLAIYFEPDSKVPEKEPYMFLASKHFKIKIQKYKTPSGHFYSQGLLMSAEDLEGRVSGGDHIILNGKSYIEGDFLTKELGVKYADPDDNKRKANKPDPNAKYKSMMARHPKFAKTKFARWCMKHEWTKKMLYIFLGRKKDNPKGWPGHIAAKTDVERIQNMIWILNDKKPFVATEKIDGSSMSVMAERKKFGKIKQYICSRNVVFQSPDEKCYYDSNIYFEAYKKYNLGEKIIQIMNDLNLPNIALQMEVFGPSVQKRDYSLKEREIRVFHIISNKVKFPMDKVVEICEKYDIPHVPIIDYNYILPNTLEELQEYVEGEMSAVDGEMKEGIVFYDKETGQQYFKFVSPEFLLKYHN